MIHPSVGSEITPKTTGSARVLGQGGIAEDELANAGIYLQSTIR
jgi:hypothetical protein